MTAKRADPSRERDVSRLARDWLTDLRGIDVHRRNVGSMRREYKGKSRVIGFGEPGACDYWYVHNPSGLHVDLEIKRPGVRPRLDQIVWMLRVNAAGGLACWVDNLETLQRVHDHIGRGFRIYMYESGSYDLITDAREARTGAIHGLHAAWARGALPHGQRKAVERILSRDFPQQGDAQ